MFNDNDRGQVGIGTLIVFIAMVLVAAIAAGVLINTAGLLQSQAEATGEESAEQVTDRVQVTSVTGVAGDEDDQLTEEQIDRISLSVNRGAGSGDLALENAIIEVFANGFSDTLTFSETATNTDPDQYELVDVVDDTDASDDSFLIGDSDDIAGEFLRIPTGEFAIVSIQGAEGGVLSDSSDRAELVFDLGSIDDPGATLEAGESLTVTVTTAQGGTAFVEKRAPSTVNGGETYRL